ncbi:MEDS domain-containing protein [Actinomadura flavalba]|uniref:MEDS domain-containing protein n=1 Tax=Actinomadura flavalba TaxID=1120938 RepID=UPI00037EA82E|nr:MEDS domain-containing protein [Actinomadura flavalba]
MRSWFDTRCVGDVRPGDHAWLPYSGADERDHIVGRFVAAALATREKLVYITDADPDALPGVGADPGAHLASGQLSVLPRAHACLDGYGAFDPARLAATIEREVAAGVAADFRAVRITLDYTPMLREGGLPGLLGCEDEVEHTVAPSTMSMAVCQIDRRACPPADLAALAGTHDLRVEPDALYDDGTLRIVPTFAPRGLRVEGEVDAARHALLGDHLARAVAAGHGVRLDCARLDFLDLAGFNLLIRHAEALRPGEALILDDLPPSVENVIDMVGWHRLPGLRRGRVRVPLDQAGEVLP